MPLSSADRAFERYRRTGAARAFAAFYDRTIDAVLRVAVRLARDPAETEDVIQATYLAVIEGRESFERGRPVVPWLVAVCANQARKLRRREGVRRRPLAPEPVAGPGPLDAARRAELEGAVARALERLPERYRSVLTLHLVHGLRSTEIAAALARAPATVRSQLMRGLDLLRKRLPQGLASLGVASPAHTRGLPALRAELLAAAAARAPVAAQALGILTLAIAMKKLAAVLACLAVACATLWLVPQWQPAGHVPGPESAPAAAPASARATTPRAERAGAEPARERIAPESRPVATTAALGLRVLWAADRSPARGVHARIVPWARSNAGAFPIAAVTDVEGRLEVEGLEPGGISVFFDRDDPCDRVGDQVAQLRAGVRSTAEVLLPSGVTVDVRVQQPDRTPIAGARVWMSGWSPNQWGCEVGTTDALGLCTLEHVQPGHSVAARAAGFVPSGTHSIPKQDGRQEVELTLRPGAGEVLVQVTGPDGRPCSCAEIRLGPWAPTASDGGLASAPPCALARADELGNARLEGIPPGSCDLVVRARGLGAAADRVTVRAGECAVARVALPGAARITGRVADPRGTAIAFASVSASDVGGRFGLRTAVSDREGRYVVEDVGPGPHDLRAGHDAWLPTAERIDVPGGQELARDLVLQAPSSADAIAGRLADDRQRPLAGWTLRAWPSDGSHSWTGVGRTDRAGKFSLAKVQAERCDLAFFAPDDKRWVCPVVEALSVARGTVDLQPLVSSALLQTGTILARAVDGARQPLAGATLVLRDEQGRQLGVCSGDAKGVLRAEGVPPRRFVLEVQAPGKQPRNVAGCVVAPGGTLELGDVVLE